MSIIKNIFGFFDIIHFFVMIISVTLRPQETIELIRITVYQANSDSTGGLIFNYYIFFYLVCDLLLSFCKACKLVGGSLFG